MSDVTLIDDRVIVPEVREKTDSVKEEERRREKEERVSDPVVTTNGEYESDEEVPPMVYVRESVVLFGDTVIVFVLTRAGSDSSVTEYGISLRVPDDAMMLFTAYWIVMQGNLSHPHVGTSKPGDPMQR